MSGEQLVIYILVAGFALLQFLAGALKRRRESEMAQESPPDPGAHEADEPWWDPRPEAAPPAVEQHTAPPPAEPRLHAPERTSAHPSPGGPAPQSRRARPEPASQHRRALKDRAELRRAVELMAILGPPRSRAPDDL